MDDFPLKIRLKLGPSEDIAKIFIMETAEAEALQITAEVGREGVGEGGSGEGSLSSEVL